MQHLDTLGRLLPYIDLLFFLPVCLLMLVFLALFGWEWLRMKNSPPPQGEGMLFVQTAAGLVFKAIRRAYIRRVHEKGLLAASKDNIDLLERLILGIEYADINKKYEMRTLILFNTPLALAYLRHQQERPPPVSPNLAPMRLQAEFDAWQRGYESKSENRLAYWSGEPLDELYRLLEKLRQEYNAAKR